MFKGQVKLLGVLLSICGVCPPSAIVNCRAVKWLDALNIIARLVLVTAYTATHLFTPGSISELKSKTYKVKQFLICLLKAFQFLLLHVNLIYFIISSKITFYLVKRGAITNTGSLG
jgi:hypothetical protein